MMKPVAWLIHADYPYVDMSPPIEGGLSRTPLYAIPPGWKLVPEVPTPEMLEAPDMAEYSWINDHQVTCWEIADAYRSMLAAVPEPPTDNGG